MVQYACNPEIECLIHVHFALCILRNLQSMQSLSPNESLHSQDRKWGSKCPKSVSIMNMRHSYNTHAMKRKLIDSREEPRLEARPAPRIRRPQHGTIETRAVRKRKNRKDLSPLTRCALYT
jgi:hypothetical protein